jgi:hypothetical protein
MSAKIGMISDSTVLLPYIVANCVIGELERYLHPEKEFEDHEKLADYLADRAEHVYQKNTNFRKRLQCKRNNSGREHLYMFMRHWLAAEMYKRPGMLDRIPRSFANGLPI